MTRTRYRTTDYSWSVWMPASLPRPLPRLPAPPRARDPPRASFSCAHHRIADTTSSSRRSDNETKTALVVGRMDGVSSHGVHRLPAVHVLVHTLRACISRCCCSSTLSFTLISTCERSNSTSASFCASASASASRARASCSSNTTQEGRPDRWCQDVNEKVCVWYIHYSSPSRGSCCAPSAWLTAAPAAHAACTTAQHSTAQHSTAQHSTAQHSTAQHSTAQHSTAQ
eukprot:COSAG06_NODE_492_length_15074_cov_26.658564_1_plen_226_part_10